MRGRREDDERTTRGRREDDERTTRGRREDDEMGGDGRKGVECAEERWTLWGETCSATRGGSWF
jgi:hypothetical protein